MADLQTQPHPSRPRTRDDNDPTVIADRNRSLARNRRARAEDPEAYLAKKREYNKAHVVQRAEYARAYRARKLAERPPPRTEEEDKIVLVNMLDMLKAMLEGTRII